MNYYEILKVSQKATDAEIKSSYKNLVKKYHPDLYKGDKNFAEQKIKEINEAYDVLSNPKTRKEYDDFLNPLSEPTPTYTQASTSSYSHTQQSRPQSQQWSFFGFIEKKFNKLDSNKQAKFLVIIFFFVLLLFLINVIQTHNYLKNQQNKEKQDQNPDLHENIQYYDYNSKTMDELFYEMIIQSEKNIYDSYYNITQQQNTTTP